MNSEPTPSSVWQLDATSARLQTGQFSARVDLLNSARGLHDLAFNQRKIDATVLGVTTGVEEKLTAGDIADAFVRGNDLVVTYSETEQRPFSVQVYWRASVGSEGSLLLDTIMSLQTDALESYPGLATRTRLPARKTWQIAAADQLRAEFELSGSQARQLSDSDGDAILLQSVGDGLSYAEITHPTDRGETSVERTDDDAVLMVRRLGGRFLEKGVIRRLRVRGVFLPGEIDFESAAHCLSGLASEQPPLTV